MEIKMAKVQVSIVHDPLGRIVSINRPAKGAKVVVLCGNGQSIFVTDVDEKKINSLIHSHRVDVSSKSLVEY
jgi:hypothetical protein